MPASRASRIASPYAARPAGQSDVVAWSRATWKSRYGEHADPALVARGGDGLRHHEPAGAGVAQEQRRRCRQRDQPRIGRHGVRRLGHPQRLADQVRPLAALTRDDQRHAVGEPAEEVRLRVVGAARQQPGALAGLQHRLDGAGEEERIGRLGQRQHRRRPIDVGQPIGCPCHRQVPLAQPPAADQRVAARPLDPGRGGSIERRRRRLGSVEQRQRALRRPGVPRPPRPRAQQRRRSVTSGARPGPRAKPAAATAEAPRSAARAAAAASAAEARRVGPNAAAARCQARRSRSAAGSPGATAPCTSRRSAAEPRRRSRTARAGGRT